ncbi:hypothetical protein RhiirC2_712011 [Rhizophagus irregularis]|uniref:Uncharacterized protein n=1 Tax=Rhizophagus irregularis TaxID=588596 RepID=A0A2N1N8R1_9GLOM|nr:hypothetical protein RhiirC2_712011 [Rhizophagus irregularis]
MEEKLKQYMTEYYRGFIGFELEYIEDFYQSVKTYQRINLREYETSVLEKDIIFPPGEITTGVRDERAIFIMKLGGETVKRILEKILIANPQEGAAKEEMDNQLKFFKTEA